MLWFFLLFFQTMLSLKFLGVQIEGLSPIISSQPLLILDKA